MSAALTNDGSDIINKTIIPKFTVKIDDNIFDTYEVYDTADWVKANNYTKIGLQCPNEFFSIIIPIILKLQSLVPECVFAHMADTNFGQCCIDEVGGENASVQAIVHYGNSCLTSTHRKIPVKRVMGKFLFSNDHTTECYNDILEHINPTSKTCVTLLSNHQYTDFSQIIANRLSAIDDRICVHRTLPNTDMSKENLAPSNYDIIGSRIFLHNEDCIESDQKLTLFICDDIDYSVKATLLSLLHLRQPTAAYRPRDRLYTDITSDIDRLMRSRLQKIEVARAGRRVGLLVGTLSAEGYLETHDYLARLLRQAGKAVYSLVVGKINPQKLTNFADLDFVVVVTCADSCLRFSDRQDGFFRPVITPYEAVCACCPSTIDNPYVRPYVTDFRQLLRWNLQADVAEDTEAPSLSMVTGRLLPVRPDGCRGDSRALVAREDADWTLAAVDRAQRSWFGLEARLGLDEVAVVVEGRRGVAAAYEDEAGQR